MTAYRLGDIRPNPFRQIEHYPINPEKIAALRESIERTGFWGNVVVREPGPELAYGHHRLVALKDLYGDDYAASFIVQDLDDDTMYDIMVRENAREWATDAAIDQETVRALLAGYAEGRLHLDAPDAKTSRDHVRYARDPGPEHPYTAETLAERLGWNIGRVKYTLAALDHLEEYEMPEDTFRGLGSTQARDVIQAARDVARRSAGAPDRKERVQNTIRTATEAIRRQGETKGSEALSAAAVEANLPEQARDVPPPDAIVQSVETRIRGFFNQRVTVGQSQTIGELLAFVADHKDDQRAVWKITGRPFAETLADALTGLAREAKEFEGALR